LCLVTDHPDKVGELLRSRVSLGIEPWAQTVRYVKIFIRFTVCDFVLIIHYVFSLP